MVINVQYHVIMLFICIVVRVLHIDYVTLMVVRVPDPS